MAHPRRKPKGCVLKGQDEEKKSPTSREAFEGMPRKEVMGTEIADA